jgi:hypothetical protein
MKALHESRNRGRNNFVAAAVAAAAAANSAAAAAVASDVEKDVGGKLVITIALIFPLKLKFYCVS